MNNDDLIDDWDNADYEVFKQWDEEEKNKRLEELQEELDKTRLSELDKEYRISKAIELIKRSANYKGICTQQETDTFSKLLNILEGSGKE